MLKTIELNGKKVRFKTSAAVLHIYRRKYGRDLLIDMAKLESQLQKDENGASGIPLDSLQIFEEMAYIFAKHAEPDKVPDDIEEWLDQFETFDIFRILPEIISMWADENKTTSKLKKKNGKSTAK